MCHATIYANDRLGMPSKITRRPMHSSWPGSPLQMSHLIESHLEWKNSLTLKRVRPMDENLKRKGLQA